MRVHESDVIRRRPSVVPKGYQAYLVELREDFHKRCGYCGKPESITTKGFEIDHFVPKSLMPEWINNYQNLVYSCYTCNRKKGKKWPTGDPNLHNDGVVGFVDPATDAFDEHVVRNEDGTIVGRTTVGTYMCHNVLRFHKRPMKTIWRAMQILTLKKQLNEKLSQLDDAQKEEYIRIDNELESLLNRVFETKE